MWIGLTGGIGSGKSTVLGFFREEGAHVVETDALTRQLLADNVEVQRAVCEAFGEKVKASQGGIDRSVLARIVFADPEALKTLETILHPRVRELWQEEVEQHRGELGVVEIPLLFEKKLESHFRFTLCISVSIATALSRLGTRGVAEDDARARMERQLPLEEKRLRSDFVISNNGSIDYTRLQVKQFCRELSSLSQPR